MPGKPRSVDLGPIYLQVGEDPGAQGFTAPKSEADADDVSRFDSLMRRGRGQRQQAEVAPEALMALIGEQGVSEFAQPEEVGAELAYLWVGTGLQSAREVRVGLREALLPDTSVRLYEDEGRLCIEFTCGTGRVARWLERKLRILAGDIGQRLDRELSLSVYMGDGSLAATRAWPEKAA